MEEVPFLLYAACGSGLDCFFYRFPGTGAGVVFRKTIVVTLYGKNNYIPRNVGDSDPHRPHRVEVSWYHFLRNYFDLYTSRSFFRRVLLGKVFLNMWIYGKAYNFTR